MFHYISKEQFWFQLVLSSYEYTLFASPDHHWRGFNYVEHVISATFDIHNYEKW